jgi:hypothetical protein
MLHREPDELGLDYYIGVLEDGVLTRPELILIFCHSLEYQAANADRKLVYQLYLGLLGRVPETEGYECWLIHFSPELQKKTLQTPS